MPVRGKEREPNPVQGGGGSDREQATRDQPPGDEDRRGAPETRRVHSHAGGPE